MSLDPQRLEQHCQTILRSRRIKDKIVVLCEGEIPNLQGRPSPQSYGRMEQTPDANFYKECVPDWWRRQKAFFPQFFNCGDRSSVIKTFFRLQELHREDESNSYLSPEKLFAIVDLDLAVQTIADYDFTDTEAIFQDLYAESKVRVENTDRHRIWVTGLIHKEAYFLLPELQAVFNDSSPYELYAPCPQYAGQPLELEVMHLAIAAACEQDRDLQNYLQQDCDRLRGRIDYCPNLSCTTAKEFGDSWKAQFNACRDKSEKGRLVRALLKVRKAKDHWHQLEPPSDFSRSPQTFRDMFSLAIARFYSRQSGEDTSNHLSVFFQRLYKRSRVRGFS